MSFRSRPLSESGYRRITPAYSRDRHHATLATDTAPSSARLAAEAAFAQPRQPEAGTEPVVVVRRARPRLPTPGPAAAGPQAAPGEAAGNAEKAEKAADTAGSAGNSEHKTPRVFRLELSSATASTPSGRTAGNSAAGTAPTVGGAAQDRDSGVRLAQRAPGRRRRLTPSRQAEQRPGPVVQVLAAPVANPDNRTVAPMAAPAADIPVGAWAQLIADCSALEDVFSDIRAAHGFDLQEKPLQAVWTELAQQAEKIQQELQACLQPGTAARPADLWTFESLA